MKISILLIFISAFNLLAKPGYSQSEKISLKLTNLNTIENVILEIERTTDYVFIYNEDVISTLRNEVDVEVTNQSLDEILNLLLEGTDLAYSLSSKQVTLYKDESKKAVKNPSTTELLSVQQQTKKNITGTIVDEQGEPIIGANIIEKGTTNGTVTDYDGKFALNVDVNAILRISYIGFLEQEIKTEGLVTINVTLIEDTKTLDELVVVGYGVQKKSDVTGSVASVSSERLEMLPNVNIAQAIQGSISGVMVQTSSSGAAASEAIMVRGRNSIKADNTPLIVVDDVPYGGELRDINPNNVESIEILKDASSAAIYGSRGANGVILITTKQGADGAPKISYQGLLSIQNMVNIPNMMDGDEFYHFKMIRDPQVITSSEIDVYESERWVDWIDEALRTGLSHEHNVSVSGGIGKTSYYIGGGLLDIRGLAENDNFKRVSGRINLNTAIRDWLTFGTRTQYSNEDRSGASPSVSGIFGANPLSKVREEDGSLALVTWPENAGSSVSINPLENLLYDDTNTASQLVSNNFINIEFPFIEGLSYRLNTGFRLRTTDQAQYRGRNTRVGQDAGSEADISRDKAQDIVVENLLSYNRLINNHNIFITAVLGYEEGTVKTNSLYAKDFPNDLITIYSSAQANVRIPDFYNYRSMLHSQMLRLNYGYDSRYLITLTGRRDGYSGFGENSKWGVFPSIALAWNFAEEEFFPWGNVFDQFKPRISYGSNGNQAVDSYQSMAFMGTKDMVYLGSTAAGFIPSTLAQQNLGWEESKTVNFGLDFSLFNNRVTGDLNYYRTNTTNLLLNRTIPSIHGVTSIIQNIGETRNIGVEFSLHSTNIQTNNFTWRTIGNLWAGKNEIVDLYGTGVDDPANNWFIGQPIRVVYDFVVDGVWQLDETEEAEKWGSQPGFVKLKDVDKDGKITGDDRQIIGQEDPKMIWGLTNSLSYKNFNFEIFIHGVLGNKKFNELKTDEDTLSETRRNTTKKNWWTPENPTNEFVMNHLEAEKMSGIRARWYESAAFTRIKDMSFSYNIPEHLVAKAGMSNMRVYVTGRNLFTFTNYGGVDPELSSTKGAIPLQREFVFGLNLEF